MKQVCVTPGEDGRLIVQFPYSEKRVDAIKGVPGRVWHPEEKYWSIPNTQESLVVLRKLFTDERVVIENEEHSRPRLHRETISAIVTEYGAMLKAKGVPCKNSIRTLIAVYLIQGEASSPKLTQMWYAFSVVKTFKTTHMRGHPHDHQDADNTLLSGSRSIGNLQDDG